METLLAGFGLADMTPEESVPMACYGDDLRRFSEGVDSPLEVRALVVTDSRGASLVQVVLDLGCCLGFLGTGIKIRVEQELGIPADHVLICGTHTHNSVALEQGQLDCIARYREKVISQTVKAVRQALADRQPCRIMAGSIMTENLNFVRRYIMDDGSLKGDNAYGTGTTVVAHESQADPQLQLVLLKREGKDILLSNYQAHPHLEGKKSRISSQTIGAFRRLADERFGVHTLHWNGGAGNINSASRFAHENRTKDQEEWAGILTDYVAQALPTLKAVKSGKIRVVHRAFTAPINHGYDGLVPQAKDVAAYFEAGHTAKETAAYARQYGIHSYYHAVRIIANAQAGESDTLELSAFAFGDIGGVTLPREMFDTTCMAIKEASPFALTVMAGYAHPFSCGYIPSAQGFQNGGYEADNCTFAPGTAEKMAVCYLDMLRALRQE